jgi:UDP-N-acetylglucosamine 2-epimerase (hydrolysing)
VHRALIVFGTRPEIIKLGPVYRSLRDHGGATVDTFWTGQHIDLADGLMELFEIESTHSSSDVMMQKSLPEKTGRILTLLGEILRSVRYDSIIVQGDTLSAMAGAMAGFLHRVPVAHVEAGLRTHDLHAPWPEEYSRRVIGIGADLHFPPTRAARNNLVREGVPPDQVHVTGNTVVDALEFVRSRLADGNFTHNRDIARVPTDKKLILVTGHRRENFGQPMVRVLAALRALADDGDKILVFPVHPNPSVRQAVAEHLGNSQNILLIDPLRYKDFVYLLARAWTVVTDSGGIQEEAPSFGVPVVITREVTERPEVVEAGFGHLVGSDTELIVETVRALTAGSRPTRVNTMSPFGDGHAARRITSILIDKPEADVAAVTGLAVRAGTEQTNSPRSAAL